ncbi:MAG: hypothetical protein CL609_19315 [Anaerolineaceae bacterium]|nr:hypothetical protein [Anaerolineaceae bacterium]
MTFNFQLGFKQAYRAIFKSTNTHYALRPRRIVVLLLFYLFFPIIEIITWIAFLLDRILYPQFEDLKIKNPVFVIGNYRSGTTLLHRLLSYDYKRFTSMTGWEIFIAPSIVQRKVLRLFTSIDQVFGSPIVRTFDYLWEKFAQGPVYFHKMGVREPEEDENLLAHIWSGIIPINMFPDFESGGLPGYAFFDKLLNSNQKKRVMNFYKGCLQRHMYYHGGNKIYLSKSPSFSGNIETLIEAFPDAKFIYLVRSPFEVVPSAINLWAFKWHVTLEPTEEYPYKDQVLNMIKYWYLHPIEVLKKIPQNQYQTVYYDQLINQPDITIHEIYEKFNYTMNFGFKRRLHKAIRKQKNYKRPKKYPLKKMGLSAKKIFLMYKKVFKQYKMSPTSPFKIKINNKNRRKFLPFVNFPQRRKKNNNQLASTIK